MSTRQKVVLVADQNSLVNIYNLACIKKHTDIQTMIIAVASLAGINGDRDRDEPDLLNIVGAMAVGFISKKKPPIITTATYLEKIQQSLGLALDLDYLSLKEATKISLPIGEIPKNGCFYISDLIKEDCYIPIKEYNNHLAKEKNIIFMRLAAALGAKSIKLEDAHFYNSKGKLETNSSLLNNIALDIGIVASFKKDGSLNNEYLFNFGSNNRVPSVPEDLKKWVSMDSDLALMASHRLENNLLSQKITLSFKDTLNGAAEVAARITDTNISLGGILSGQKQVSSTWTFEVEYYPLDNSLT